jgi:predicted ribosomally synthesized peptide with nif11-like leader
MSVENVASFLEKVNSDDATRKLFFSAIEDNDEAQVPQTLVQLGAQSGFAFTEAEIVQARDVLEIQAKQAAGEELSDEQLEMVAGGMDRRLEAIEDKYVYTPTKTVLDSKPAQEYVKATDSVERGVKKAFKGW